MVHRREIRPVFFRNRNAIEKFVSLVHSNLLKKDPENYMMLYFNMVPYIHITQFI